MVELGGVPQANEVVLLRPRSWAAVATEHKAGYAFAPPGRACLANRIPIEKLPR
jgi:hypothetical protein